MCVLLAVVLGEVTHRPRLAGTAALLFAAHPVHTEAVASVVGRAEELAALGGLGAWWLVLRARRDVRGRSVWLGSAALALAAGVLAKENAATIPAVVIAADAIVGPGVMRARHDNLLIIRSDYEQPFGTFRGTLPGGVELAEGYGVMERHTAVW